MTLDESSRLPEGGVQVVPRDVISEVFGGEAVVVQLATGAYYSLDALRTSQFESLCGGSTIRSLVPRGADATSVLSFVRFLVDAGCDVPRHLLERLVGRGLRRKAAERVRAALTLPSALPRQKKSRSGSGSSGSSSGSSGSSSGSSGSSSGSSSGEYDDEDEGSSGDPPPSPSSAPPSSSSPSPSSSPPPPQFERLEYLGDAVLELAAREWSLARFPRATEHGLSNSARSLVCGRSLLAAAAAARLDVFVTSNARSMSREEYLTHWAGSGGLASLVDAVEAVAGALYLEFGLRGAADWVLGLALGVSVAADDDDDNDDLERRGEELGDDFDDFFDDDDDDDEKEEEEQTTKRSSGGGGGSGGGGRGGGGTRLLLDNNYKSLLAIVAGHASVEYRGSHVLSERGWGGHSPGHPTTKGSAALPAGDSHRHQEQQQQEHQQQRPPSRAAWLWVSRVFVDGELRGIGADVHRPTAEQAAARQALAGAGVDADQLWRERLADQM